jgi:hypothetical protein
MTALGGRCAGCNILLGRRLKVEVIGFRPRLGLFEP